MAGKSPHPTRVFLDPDDMEFAWMEYRDWVKEESKEWVKVQYVGKDGARVTDRYKLPLVLEGFYRFCKQEKGGSCKHYFVNSDGYYDDFRTICDQIKDEIRENHITGGMLNVFNPSITQRLQGMVDKTEVSVSKVKVSFKRSSDSAKDE